MWDVGVVYESCGWYVVDAFVCHFCGAEAVPKRILELMGVHGLTRENVASHLQVQLCTT